MEHISFSSLNDLSTFGAQELSPTIFRAIESSLELGHFDGPLLQNLSQLTIGQHFGGVSLRDICVFLGPRLKTLCLTIPISPDGLGTFVKALKARCPAIENLYISSYNFSERVTRVMSDLICGLSSLRTISCKDVTFDLQTLKYISSLPFLQTLDVRLPKMIAQGEFLDGSSNILPFLAMRHLHVSVGSIVDAALFLIVISRSLTLESLCITFDRIVLTPQQLHAVFTIMQRSSFCGTLTTFALRDEVELIGNSPPLHSLDAHTLSPLFQCRNLEHVTINISYGHAAIDNALLQEIASAWPRLRYISLHPYYHDLLWHSRANLGGLIHLALHCRSLQSVDLQFDISLPSTAMYPDKETRCESLTQLFVSQSHVSDPVAVATFLGDVFPNLRLCHHYFVRTSMLFEDPKDEQSPDSFMEMAKRWKIVDEMLKERRQELPQSLMNPNVRMQSSIYR